MECIICFDTIPEKKIGRLPCKHEFCIKCIKKWIQTDKRCPMCRRKARLKDIQVHDNNTKAKPTENMEIVKCPVEYCYRKIQRRNFDSHMDRCHHIVECSQCYAPMMHHMLQKHMLQECIQRTILCKTYGCTQQVPFVTWLQMEEDSTNENDMLQRLRIHHHCRGRFLI